MGAFKRELVVLRLGALVSIWAVAACASHSDITPEELEVRDLLGLAPEVATTWSASERTAARETLRAAMADSESGELALELDAELAANTDAALIRAIELADRELSVSGALPRMLVLAEPEAAVAVVHAIGGAVLEAWPEQEVPSITFVGWSVGAEAGWDVLADRAPSVVVALAMQAGHEHGADLEVAPAPRVAFAAVYDPTRQRLLVNPVVLAALELEAADGHEVASSGGGSRSAIVIAGSAITKGAGQGGASGASRIMFAEALAPDAGDPLDPTRFGSHGDGGHESGGDDGCDIGCGDGCGDGCGGGCGNSGNNNCAIHRTSAGSELALGGPLLFGLIWVRRRMAARAKRS